MERFYAGVGERSEVAQKENGVLEGSEAERRKPVSTESETNEWNDERRHDGGGVGAGRHEARTEEGRDFERSGFERAKTSEKQRPCMTTECIPRRISQ